MKLLKSIAILLILCVSQAQAAYQGIEPGNHDIPTPKKYTEDLDIIEDLGKQVPLDIAVTDEKGNKKTFADYFNGEKPTVLCLVYYKCQSTCGPLQNHVFQTISKSSLKPGDYNVLFLSFDPKENAELAAANKKSYLNEFGMENVADSFHYLTTDAVNIKRVTDAMGFQYRAIGTADYSHPTVTYIITADGKISRYMYQFGWNVQTLKFSLMDAADNKIGSAMDKIIKLCYTFDPKNHQYVRNSMMLMSIAGALTLMCLAAFLGVLWYKEFKNKQTT